MKITDIIQPIQLLAGSHKDTGSTGQGCFMNVIAYLNGEAQITDRSECVCPTIRPIAIFANDFMHDAERIQLLPFIERAMGSATDDIETIVRRARRVVRLADEMGKTAAESAECAADEFAKYAAKYAAESAECAAKYAEYAAESAEHAESAAECAAKSAKYAEYAAESAEHAESAAECAAKSAKCAEYAAKSAKNRKAMIDSLLSCLDDLCPRTDQTDPVIFDRAKRLVSLSS